MILMSLLFEGSQLKDEMRRVMRSGATRSVFEGFDRVAPAPEKQNGKEKKGVGGFLNGAVGYDRTVLFIPWQRCC